jgi:hypothetical protein
MNAYNTEVNRILSEWISLLEEKRVLKNGELNRLKQSLNDGNLADEALIKLILEGKTIL